MEVHTYSVKAKSQEVTYSNIMATQKGQSQKKIS